MATKKELTMSEQLYAMAQDARSARERLKDGKYKNGCYSSSAGANAQITLGQLQLALEKMAKQALIAEVRAEVREQLLAQIHVQIGV